MSVANSPLFEKIWISNKANVKSTLSKDIFNSLNTIFFINLKSRKLENLEWAETFSEKLALPYYCRGKAGLFKKKLLRAPKNSLWGETKSYAGTLN